MAESPRLTGLVNCRDSSTALQEPTQNGTAPDSLHVEHLELNHRRLSAQIPATPRSGFPFEPLVLSSAVQPIVLGEGAVVGVHSYHGSELSVFLILSPRNTVRKTGATSLLPFTPQQLERVNQWSHLHTDVGVE